MLRKKRSLIILYCTKIGVNTLVELKRRYSSELDDLKCERNSIRPRVNVVSGMLQRDETVDY